jgi:hypothetical protein
MTPKEKAIQLVEKFDASLNHLRCGTNGIEEYIHERAISCALIAVDEMKIAVKNSVERKRTYTIPKIVSKQYDFLQQVRQEIEKL